MIKARDFILRNFRESDSNHFFSLVNDLSQREDYDDLNIHTPAEWESIFGNIHHWEQDKGQLLITDYDDNILGDIAFFKGHFYFTGFEIGYRLFRFEHRGQGLMSRVLPLFCAYIFNIKDIPRLYLQTLSNNVASKKVAEKAGFEYHGTLPKAGFCRGKNVDLDCYSLLKENCMSYEEALKL